MDQERSKEPKFKFTRELVRIAQNEGMTQVDIAKLCRTQQSVVSHWLDGSSKAKQAQIAPLLQRFGHKLNRTTSRVYLVEDQHDPSTRWEDTERAKALLALQASMPGPRFRNSFDRSELTPDDVARWEEWEKEWRAYVEAWAASWRKWYDPPADGIEEEIAREKKDFASRTRPFRLVVVEGPVIFRHAFRFPYPIRRGRQWTIAFDSTRRWQVHQQGTHSFIFVQLARRLLKGSDGRLWQAAINPAQMSQGAEVTGDLFRPSFHHAVQAADESASWAATISPAQSLQSLLSACDKALALDEDRLIGPHDRAAVPFLLRKALVERGFDVPGVERIVPRE